METRGRKRKQLQQSTTTAPENGKYYTVAEAAKLLGVHVHTVQARLRDGTIKGKKLGKAWKIYKDELLKKG